jgi:EAL domain-containing protein (putative c-di-GMP-specific phosphodiesterase class I)
LHIDDFGTGYSSLSYLQRFDADALKVDRSFVTKMSDSKDSAELVRTIVNMAHNLGMKVVAEGVETAEQYTLLRALGCEYVQGYLFSKPVPAAAAALLLLNKDGTVAA